MMRLAVGEDNDYFNPWRYGELEMPLRRRTRNSCRDSCRNQHLLRPLSPADDRARPWPSTVMRQTMWTTSGIVAQQGRSDAVVGMSISSVSRKIGSAVVQR